MKGEKATVLRELQMEREQIEKTKAQVALMEQERQRISSLISSREQNYNLLSQMIDQAESASTKVRVSNENWKQNGAHI